MIDFTAPVNIALRIPGKWSHPRELGPASAGRLPLDGPRR